MSLEVKCSASDSEKHDHDINALYFHHGRIFSGADDFKLKVWDLNLNLQAEVLAHDCSVYSITAINDNIYSCSNDGTLKSWTMDLKPQKTLMAIESELWKLATANEILYVGDDSGLVMTFKNEEAYQCYELLEPIKDLVVQDNLLFTIRDLYLSITEMLPIPPGERKTSPYTLRKTLEGKSPVCLIENDLIVVCGRSGRDIIVYNNSTSEDFNEIATITDAHTMIINALQGGRRGPDNILYSGGWDKVLRKWRIIPSGSIELITELELEFVINSLLLLDNGEVIVAGDGGTMVKVQG